MKKETEKPRREKETYSGKGKIRFKFKTERVTGGKDIVFTILFTLDANFRQRVLSSFAEVSNVSLYPVWTDSEHDVVSVEKFPEGDSLKKDASTVFIPIAEVRVRVNGDAVRNRIESLSSRNYRGTDVVGRVDPLSPFSKLSVVTAIKWPIQTQKYTAAHDCTTPVRYRCSSDGEFGAISPSKLVLSKSTIFEYIKYRREPII